MERYNYFFFCLQAKEIGFTNPQLARLLAAVAQAQEISNAVALSLKAFGVALRHEASFGDTVCALESCAENASAVIGKYDVQPHKPLACLHAIMNVLCGLLTDLQATLDQQRKSGWSIPATENAVRARDDQLNQLVQQIQEQLQRLLSKGEVEVRDLQLIEDVKALRNHPDVASVLCTIRERAQLLSRLEGAVDAGELEPVKNALSMVEQTGLVVDAGILLRAQSCITALTLMKTCRAVLVAPISAHGLQKQLADLRMLESEPQLASHVRPDELEDIISRIEAKVLELKTVESFCSRVKLALECPEVSSLQDLLDTDVPDDETAQQLAQTAREILRELQEQEAKEAVDEFCRQAMKAVESRNAISLNEVLDGEVPDNESAMELATRVRQVLEELKLEEAQELAEMQKQEQCMEDAMRAIKIVPSDSVVLPPPLPAQLPRLSLLFNDTQENRDTRASSFSVLPPAPQLPPPLLPSANLSSSKLAVSRANLFSVVGKFEFLHGCQLFL